MSAMRDIDPEGSHSEGARCPVGPSDRRATREDGDGPGVERVPGGWIIRSAEVARTILRQGDATRQAGFGGELTDMSVAGSLPLLYNFGANHRRQRSNVARFFTPKAVDTRYRELMDREVARAVKRLSTGQPVAVDPVSMYYSVAVAREVLGLTDSSVSGLARRLNRFFGTEITDRATLAGRLYQVVSLAKLAAFYLRDVRPAVRRRRRQPEDDVISYLISEGHSDVEILMDAITYAAAGMVTTREFITVALWHLLDNEPLRARYLVAEQRERYAILHELLRLEPIVGTLLRRVVEDITVTHDGVEHTLRKGDRVTISVRWANVDPTVVGECPVTLRPGREMRQGYKADVVAFGEGPHRCPGSFLAIQESDMLLRQLLALPFQTVQTPTVSNDPLLESLVLRGLRIKLDDERAPDRKASA